MARIGLVYVSIVFFLPLGLIELFFPSGKQAHFQSEVAVPSMSIDIPSEALTSMSLYNCSGCPEIAGIMADPCNGVGVDEQDNEFMIVLAGCGFAVNDLTVDVSNNAIASNDDLGTASCPFTTPSASLMAALSGCASITAAGPGDNIPAQAIVLVFTDSDAGSVSYDLSGLCSAGEDIYVLQNSCTRTIGAFANYFVTDCTPGPDTRTYSITIPSCASDSYTY
ncbi:MAG: hypothetical protein R3330_14680, partial [Saprospiraceae bacterium]|nr:hypothetical protein [Saprospiraceae bacterium]